MTIDATILRESILEELRKTSLEGRVYRTDTAWPVGPLTDQPADRGDPNYVSALPLAEALGNALQIATGILLHTNVISIYNNTNGLPSAPAIGDSYIAAATAHGWTQNYIYTATGDGWMQVIPPEGTLIVWIASLKVHKFFKNNTWVDLSASAPINPLYLNEHVRLRADGRHYYMEIELENGIWESQQHLFV